MSPLPLLLRTGRGLRALLCGFAQVFLQQHPGCGLLVLLTIAFAAPAMLAGAVLGGLASMLAARVRGVPADDIRIGLYGYNGILLGLLLSLKLAWSPLLALLIAGSAALSSLLLAPWMQRMRERDWLPAFTVPFVLLGCSLLALSTALNLPAASAAAPLTAVSGLPDVPLGVLRGLAQVVFLDSALAGLCLLLALALADRRAALWAVLAAAAGFTAAHLFAWPAQQALAGLYGYNAVLATIALAQVQRTPLAPLAGLLLALALQVGFAAVGLVHLTLPFILACWLVLCSQRLARRTIAQ